MRRAADAEQAFGRIDALISNAAIGPCRPFVESDADALRRLIAVNLMGPLLLTRVWSTCATCPTTWWSTK